MEDLLSELGALIRGGIEGLECCIHLLMIMNCVWLYANLCVSVLARKLACIVWKCAALVCFSGVLVG